MLFRSLIVGELWSGFKLEQDEGQDEAEEDADIIQGFKQSIFRWF